MKLIKAFPIANGFETIQIPFGRYESFIINISGVNAGGATLAIGQLGQVRSLHNGRQFQYIELDRLSILNGYKGGSVAAASAIGAAFNWTFRLPQAYWGDNENCLFVEQDGQVVLEMDQFYSAGAAVIASGTVRVWGVERKGIQKYFFKIDQRDFNAVNGTGSETLQGIENFYELFLAYDANFTQTSILVDGQAIISEATLQGLIDDTNQYNNVETYNATIPMLDLPLARTMEITDALGDTLTIQYLTAAAIASWQVTCFSIDFDYAKEVASAAMFKNELANKLKVKSASGKDRAVTAILGND